jgi:gamma-glutamyltranspeptidase/glutathione hydrolase
MPGGFTCRPSYRGRRGLVTAGHYLAAMAGYQTLARGGNAVDAAVAAGLTESLVEPNQNSLGGENPMIVWPSGRDEPVVLCGQGASPAGATIEAMRALGIRLIPGDGYLAACVPAAVSTYLTALMEFGTMSFAEVAAPALELARNGFVVTAALADAVAGMAKRFREEWPSSAHVYLKPDGAPYREGEVFCNPDWAETVGGLVRAEKEAGGNRLRGLERAHHCFYRGEVADRIARALDGAESLDASGSSHGPLLTAEDLGRHETRLERPVALDYHGATVWKCGPWSQGPVFLQQLALLAGYDLSAMGWGTAECIHTVAECAKLAFADREAWYGDPDFSDVPLERLLSPGYNAERRRLISPDRAITEPLWDDIQGDAARTAGPKQMGGDTTHVDAADADGLMVSLTPSGGWLMSSPVMAGLGFPLGTRAQMFVLREGHPNALAPGKRPRTTLTPSMARLQGGRRFAFGTPGGDGQDQWTLQFFLSHVVFGMELQPAVEAPTFHTRHFPSSFYPREAFPGSLVIEDGFAPDVLEELRRRGHTVETVGRWQNGRVLGIVHDAGILTAAVSPRHETACAAGW